MYFLSIFFYFSFFKVNNKNTGKRCRNMIKVNKKITRTTSLTSVLFGVFIVNFEVNVSWEGIVTRNRQNQRFNKCDALRGWLPSTSLTRSRVLFTFFKCTCEISGTVLSFSTLASAENDQFFRIF